MLGTLYIVATPIGNLEDITLRAIRILSEVDVIVAEDTRVTRKLLDSLAARQLDSGISSRPDALMPRLYSYHQHSSEAKKLEILKLLMDGKNIALVTDAGTPGISDPGNELIAFLLSATNNQQLTTNNLVPKVVPIPGPSALTTALSVSGFDASKFMFIGFWPKKKVNKLVQLIKLVKYPVVFYESPFRILKTLVTLQEAFGEDAKVVVARELTKLHETLYRGTIEEVRSELEKSSGKIKGEIVVVLDLASKGLAFQG